MNKQSETIDALGRLRKISRAEPHVNISPIDADIILEYLGELAKELVVTHRSLINANELTEALYKNSNAKDRLIEALRQKNKSLERLNNLLEDGVNGMEFSYGFVVKDLDEI